MAQLGKDKAGGMTHLGSAAGGRPNTATTGLGASGHPNSTAGRTSTTGHNIRGSAMMAAAGGAVRPGSNTYVPKYQHEPPPNGADSINQHILARVKQKFDAADQDGSGKLAPQEFVDAFLGILQTEDGGDKEALEKLFMRIDANSDGTIDWDEFSTYMLLESQGAAKVREFENTVTLQTAEPSPVADSAAHKDAITHLGTLRLANGIDRYVSCGKDGLVKLWNAKDLKPVKTLHSGSTWATCAALLPLTQKLAVGGFSRAIKIFDLASFETNGQIPEIDYVPLSMDAWVPPRAKDCELVVIGDGGGWVRLFEVRLNTPDEQKAAAAGTDRFLERPRWRYQHHTDWVMAVKYVEDMNCVLAASLDRTVSITDAEERVPLKKLEGHHTKGINTVDWSPIYKFVATGSLDRRVIMWNPFSQKPLAVLNGHASAVTRVIVNDRDNQLISLGTDRTVKVWDIRNHKCLQTLIDREQAPPSAIDVVSPAVYDSARRQLITGYLKPKVWRMNTAGAGAQLAHGAPVARVLFNDNFHEAISADHSGTVSVWYVPTGKLRYRFQRCHGDCRITAMAFDANKRRLITGAEDGSSKIWNFSSGACLSTLTSTKAKAEVSCAAPLRGPLMRYVLAAGWDRRITFYEDNSSKVVGPGRQMVGHKADILAMVVQEVSNTVISAADDGEIIVWNADSGAPKRRMTAPLASQRPSNERSVEAVGFLGGAGRLRSVVVAVGADRWMRFWDSLDGSLMLQRFTGHRQGETVQALAIAGPPPDPARSSSSSGASTSAAGPPAGPHSKQQPAGAGAGVASGAGQKEEQQAPDPAAAATSSGAGASLSGAGGGVGAATTSAAATPSPGAAAAQYHRRLIATGDSGGMIKVWDCTDFWGRLKPSDNADAFVKEVALWRGHAGHVTSLDWCHTPWGLFLASSGADCTIRLWTPEGVRVGTFGQAPWTLADPATWAAQEREPLDDRDSWIMEGSRAVPRTDPASEAQQQQQQQQGLGGTALPRHLHKGPNAAEHTERPGSSGEGDEGPDGVTAVVVPAAAGAAGPRPPYGASPRTALGVRPVSAPHEVALICEASNAARKEARISARLRHRSPRGHPGGEFGPGVAGGSFLQQQQGAGRSPRSGLMASVLQGGLSEMFDALGRGGGGGPMSDVDEQTEYTDDDGFSTTDAGGADDRAGRDGNDGSSTSSDGDSDAEVPAALWLQEFESQTRNLRLRKEGDGEAGRINASAARTGVAHLLKVSDLSALQERPATSFMSSRRGIPTAAGVITKRNGSPSPQRGSRPGTSMSTR